MIDDYSYKSQELIKKETWPNGLALESDYNLNGLVGNQRSGTFSAGSGANTGSPTVIKNPTNNISLPPAPGGTAVLGSVGGSLQWFTTIDCGATGP